MELRSYSGEEQTYRLPGGGKKEKFRDPEFERIIKREAQLQISRGTH